MEIVGWTYSSHLRDNISILEFILYLIYSLRNYIDKYIFLDKIDII